MVNRIDIDLLNNEGEAEPSIIEYGDATIEVKPVLSYPEMLVFVDFVKNACFDDDTGEYKPEMMDFAIRYAILETYTNIDVPDNYFEAYSFLYNNDELLMNIRDVISDSQFTEIINAIDKKIQAVVDTKANELLNEMSEMYNELSGLLKVLGEQFDGIDEGDIKNMVDAISKSNLDEDKFVESYMNHVNKNKKSDEGVT